MIKFILKVCKRIIFALIRLKFKGNKKSFLRKNRETLRYQSIFCSSSWFLVLGSWFLVFGSWSLVFGLWFLVFGSWFFELGV